MHPLKRSTFGLIAAVMLTFTVSSVFESGSNLAAQSTLPRGAQNILGQLEAMAQAVQPTLQRQQLLLQTLGGYSAEDAKRNVILINLGAARDAWRTMPIANRALWTTFANRAVDKFGSPYDIVIDRFSGYPTLVQGSAPNSVPVSGIPVGLGGRFPPDTPAQRSRNQVAQGAIPGRTPTTTRPTTTSGRRSSTPPARTAPPTNPANPANPDPIRPAAPAGNEPRPANTPPATRPPVVPPTGSEPLDPLDMRNPVDVRRRAATELMNKRIAEGEQEFKLRHYDIAAKKFDEARNTAVNYGLPSVNGITPHHMTYRYIAHIALVRQENSSAVTYFRAAMESPDLARQPLRAVSIYGATVEEYYKRIDAIGQEFSRRKSIYPQTPTDIDRWNEYAYLLGTLLWLEGRYEPAIWYFKMLQHPQSGALWNIESKKFLDRVPAGVNTNKTYYSWWNLLMLKDANYTEAPPPPPPGPPPGAPTGEAPGNGLGRTITAPFRWAWNNMKNTLDAFNPF